MNKLNVETKNNKKNALLNGGPKSAWVHNRFQGLCKQSLFMKFRKIKKYI